MSVNNVKIKYMTLWFGSYIKIINKQSSKKTKAVINHNPDKIWQKIT